MHIISGRFKGFPIPAALRGTRPTTDRTKEAVFSHLEAIGAVEGARVLDLYAGTGALGFEALSRGADLLESVESSGRAAGLLSKSAARLTHHPSWNPAMSIHVSRVKAERFVRPLPAGTDAESGPAAVPYDLVFMDPPYDLPTEDCQEIMAGLVKGGLVGHDSVIVLERSGRSASPLPPSGWAVSTSRSYGETVVYYIESAAV
ncbi:RsmD family RNA methyltransferase [Bifidobacterium sp. W8108]|uniref:RsmD family RNA methyltransferase n=1 Tax=unclassified Bifidobacterium TaxID=2608897 RepID=UPI0018DE3AC3|nr:MULTISPECIES: RsmD family RNA methyltransferase [unclassified Bifidobacterium]MBH9979241.1 RsmD family RNA methyltransferase [Bifidobacterium sp. W8108]MBI0172887.1 RsmD family RNA methyltransferase [Bifidobacterium sp. M0307]